MKRCPQCNRVETNDALVFCRVDGTLLVVESSPSLVDDEAATRTLQSPGASATSDDVPRVTGPTTALPGNQRTTPSISKPSSLKRTCAGVADCYSLLPQYANAPFDESMMKAKTASLKALELDNSLAEAHISLASVKQALWDWYDVEAEYKRGLALNPNYATGHQWYSEYLVPAGRLDPLLSDWRIQ